MGINRTVLGIEWKNKRPIKKGKISSVEDIKTTCKKQAFLNLTRALLEEKAEVLGTHGLLRRTGPLCADNLGRGRAHHRRALRVRVDRRREAVCRKYKTGEKG